MLNTVETASSCSKWEENGKTSPIFIIPLHDGETATKTSRCCFFVLLNVTLLRSFTLTKRSKGGNKVVQRQYPGIQSIGMICKSAFFPRGLLAS